MLTRRTLLAGAGFTALASAALSEPALRIGVMDGVLRLPCNPDAVAKARALGLGGVQVCL